MKVAYLSSFTSDTIGRASARTPSTHITAGGSASRAVTIVQFIGTVTSEASELGVETNSLWTWIRGVEI
ncbi:hypothetical protein NUW54_g3087 [Trametes sanguinea]|uniref:Uncharacterized protein n=1 Tax=Trametes sanguinea TaxID=158606 RepID=A0ACC1Q1Q2_9APHY|nr:hypothetical protein NUW54_g3087 [Trametes sanguinea]